MQVIVVGAGIGGLAAALSLHAAGIGCRVYESMQHVQPLAVGINLLPQATKELEALGVLPDLVAHGNETRELLYLTRKGERVWREPRGFAAGYRWPELGIQRADLHSALHKAVRARLGEDAIVTDRRAIGVRENEGSVEVTFCEPEDESQRYIVGADLVVGADGLHSAIRRHLYPDEGSPRFGGRVVWRGTTVMRPILDGATMIVAGNSKTKFVCYPIRTTGRGHQLIHWRAMVPSGAEPGRMRSTGSRPELIRTMLGHFADWSTDILDLPALVHGAGQIHQTVLWDRDPLPRWSYRRTTLLGDAAHPMYPIGSHGGAQAIADARRLAYELASRPTINDALAAYEGARRPPMAELALVHRAEAIDRLLDMVEARAPDGWQDIEAVIPHQERAQLAALYRWMSGSDLPALNETPPLTPPTRPIAGTS